MEYFYYRIFVNFIVVSLRIFFIGNHASVKGVGITFEMQCMYVCMYVCNDRVTECTRVRRVCTAATSGIPACTYAHVRAGYAQLVRLVWQTAGTRGCVMVTIYL